MAGTGLKREDQIDERANDMFNPSSSNPQNSDDGAGSENTNHSDLKGREDSAAQAGIDQAEAYENNPGNATSGSEIAKSQEENPMGYQSTGDGKAPASLWGRVKKQSPLGFILAILSFFGIGFGFFSGPSMLLVQMKEVFTNYGSSSSRVAPSRFEQRMMFMFGGAEGACQSKPSSIKCKRGSMKDKNVKKYQAAGFKVNSTKVGDRHVIKSVTFPDGKEVSSGREYRRYLRSNPAAASAVFKVQNPKTLVFNGGRFSSKVLSKLGLNKSRVSLAGSSDDDRKKSINKITGADKENSKEKRLAKFKSKFGSKISKAGKASRGPTAIVGFGCSLYNVPKAAIVSAKLYNVSRYAGFAMLFFKAADQIKANGSIEPETVAMLGTILTSYYTSGPAKGLTATDSQGFKVAAYGGERGLKSFTQKFLLGGNTKLIALENTMKKIEDKMPGGKKTLRAGCKGATDPVIGTGVAGLMCSSSAGSGAVAGTVVPVAGNVVGFIAVLGACAGAVVGASFAVGTLVSKVIEYTLPHVVNMITDAPIDVEKIRGVDAGNAMAAGAGAIMESTNRSRGLQPGNKNSVTSFNTALAPDDDMYDTVARYDAKDEPFNIYNEYSFMGSVVRKIGIASPTRNPGLFNTSIFSSVFSSSSILPSAHATATMPVNITKDDLSHCPDQSLKDIGVDCDLIGGTQYVMAPSISVNDNLKYMVGPHVDEDGGVVSDNYKNWIKYCTDEREDPMGSFSGPIQDENDWNTGKNCVANSSTQKMLDNFSTFYYDTAAQEDEDYEAPVEGSGIGGGSDIRIATYNVLGAHHTDPGKPRHGKYPDWNTRIKKVVENIKEKNIDVIGFQEFEPRQQKYMDDNLAGYSRTTHGKVDDGIMWNSERFTSVGKGTWKTTYFGGSINEPWVKLKDNSTEQEFYVMNVHDPINEGKGSPEVRHANALAHLVEINKLKPQAPVILTGDFNNGFTKDQGAKMDSHDRTIYCVMTSGGDMEHAYDVFSKRKKKCPNPTPSGADIKSHVDHVFVSPGLEVSKYWSIRQTNPGERWNPEGNHSGSDHPAVIADVVIPGSGSVSGGEWNWPVDKKYFDANRSDFIKEHSASSGTWTNGVDRLASDIGTPPDGSPVYAMFGGTVSQEDLRSTKGGPHGLAIKSEIQGGTLEIAYAHGPRTNRNKTYNAGDKIMEIGCLGNCSGGHLHVDMSFNDKGVCPQDVFLAFEKNIMPDFNSLTAKGKAPCDGR